MNLFKTIARKSKLAVAGTAVAFALITTGTAGLIGSTANAASCDKVNIIHCGLDGSSTADKVKSLQTKINQNSDNGHTDIVDVMRWAGAGSVDLKTLSTDNTKAGTLYRNGDVKIGSKTVGTNAWVSARFTNGSGFVKIKDGVWARKTTTSFANASAPVLVHYDGQGQVDFVVMVDCGNAVKVTPVKPTPTPTPTPTPPAPTPTPPAPAPKPMLTCSSLTLTKTSQALTYTAVATASAKNTTIKSYIIKYSDGSTETVTSSAAKVTFKNHMFADYSKMYTARVYVSGTDATNITSDSCAVSIKTPAAPVKPSLVCNTLSATPVAGKPLTYTFTAKATASKTTITKYVFYFGDNKTTPVTSTGSSATTQHAYTANDETYTATVKVYAGDFENGVTSENCAVTFTTPKVAECKPNIPVNDTRCTETPTPIITCVPTSTQDENCVEKPVVETPAELPATGPVAVAGIFAGTSALGAVAHQIIRRRNRF